ncbi:MAG TPA: UDP-N-acetylmuramoyl-L-alanyl-D-glutamate--2,6-diaminopimelate ligase, partial [Pilimelia sp.]|nr:UDP-N-acetylmuramoyl-L-alanyl-D-glutamate--2,6-diaminopimelate ligase [Pilimelia sp.]
PGARHHGADFVAEAAARGAAAVLTDAAGAAAAAAAGLPALVTGAPRQVLGEVAAAVFGDPTAALSVIGLTGTAGKTTTAYLVEAGLRAAGRVTGLIGTVETRLGDLTLTSARTTPEAPDLQASLAAARELGVTDVVMEVSSHALALHRVDGVRFAVGGWTNFGQDHLDFHADAADYFAAKARLFDGRSRTEIVNADDPALAVLVGPRTVTYSAAGAKATWRAVDVTGAGAQRFTACGPDGLAVPAGVSFPGRHSVANALLALAALAAVGVDPAVAAAAVAGVETIPGRLEEVPAAGAVRGVVDYAHKPDAVAAVLGAVRELAAAGGRVVCVLGAGGDRDTGKRPLMGAAAARGADIVVVTDDNPRTEDPAAIRAAVLAGAGGGAEVVEVSGRRAAIAAAVDLARPGDVVAVLGKGHEVGQVVGDAVLPFDDRTELAAALAARPDGGSS